MQTHLETSFQQMWSSSELKQPLSPERAESILKKLTELISESEPATKKSRINYQYMAWAACLLLIASISITIFSLRQHTGSDQIAKTAQLSKPVNISNTTTTVLNIALPDGTNVLLSPKGTLTRNADYGVKNRNVYLTGNAKFSVHKDPLRPFTVFSEKVSTTALGTVFRVTTKPDKAVDVELYEGKVVVRFTNVMDKAMAYYLLPGGRLAVDRNGKTHYVTAKKYPSATREGKTSRQQLAFKQEDLGEVFRQLAEQYQIEIDFSKAKNIRKTVFTGTVNTQNNLSSTLSLICNMNGLEFKTYPGKIVITNK